MKGHAWRVLLISSISGALATAAIEPPNELPARATAALSASLDAATRHGHHVWRDTPPQTGGAIVIAYIEIARGDRRKWEFDMGYNARAIDRVLPRAVGGYPVNYGFVPQTVSYDGDPFDVLVLGPPLPGGQLVRGAIVGLMLMEDEKGPDAKVVLSPMGANGRPSHALTSSEQERIGEYFRRYKLHEEGKFSRVPGWGSAADGQAYLSTAHAFFLQCRAAPAAPCRVDP